MKKLILITTVLVAFIGLSAYLLASLGNKNRYEKTRTELATYVLSEIPISDEKQEWLNEVRSSWTETTNQIGGPHTDALQTVGWEPSISNLIKLMTYRMPEYSAVAFGRNKRPMEIGAIQAVLTPVSTDKLIHVFGNGEVALIQHSPTLVSVFQNEEGGLREIQYHLKQQQNNESSSETDTARQED